MAGYKQTYQIVSEDSAREADCSERGFVADGWDFRIPDDCAGEDFKKWEKEMGPFFTEITDGDFRGDGVTLRAAREMACIILDAGAVIPSSSFFHVGISYETEPVQDMYSGDFRTETFHPEGWTEREEELIYVLVTGRV